MTPAARRPACMLSTAVQRLASCFRCKNVRQPREDSPARRQEARDSRLVYAHRPQGDPYHSTVTRHPDNVHARTLRKANDRSASNSRPFLPPPPGPRRVMVPRGSHSSRNSLTVHLNANTGNCCHLPYRHSTVRLPVVLGPLCDPSRTPLHSLVSTRRSLRRLFSARMYESTKNFIGESCG